jgi:tRNA G18 (ribose-2'-O)-methylase SpoU
MNKNNRGYFGIGVYKPKTATNIGTLFRSAHSFGADFIFVIGARYKKQPSDTTKAFLHLPLYEYDTWQDFKNHIPHSCQIVCVELDERAKDLKTFSHPERCIYVLGAEDNGIPKEYLKTHQIIQINGGKYCLNVAVAGSIILYDRINKQ